MTHEHQPGAEAHDGPEHDQDLPPADSIPGTLTAEQSDALPLVVDLVDDVDEDDDLDGEY